MRPDCQGEGTGGRLLRTYHEMLDQHTMPAYLEAATEHVSRLYQRHGYTRQPGTPFHLPDGGPPMWGMWREPKRTPSDVIA